MTESAREYLKIKREQKNKNKKGLTFVQQAK